MDFSIDLESLSTEPDAALLSIGIVAFDRHTGAVIDRFYAAIRWADAMCSGHVSDDTVAWWGCQSDTARAQFFSPDALPTVDALAAANLWLMRYGPAKSRLMWGNGSTFDCVVLEQAFKRFHFTTPWMFWSTRDMRTVVDLAGYRKGDIPFEGTEHNALDDATHQAIVISHCIKRLLSCNATASPLPRQPALTSAPLMELELNGSSTSLPTLPLQSQCADCLRMCLASSPCCPWCRNLTLLPVSP